jgi:hypothetical protein
MKTPHFVTRSLLTAFQAARRRPALAWVLAVAFFLATPFAPAPWAVNLAAQTYTLNSTTISATIAATDTTVALTSASAATGSTFGAVVAGQGLFVDQEYMVITAVSGSTVTVQRRNNRTTPPTTHLSGQTVYIGAPAAFQTVDPGVGVCAVGSQGDPFINITNGKVWRCLASTWLNVIDAYVFVGPGSCFGSTTGGTLTTPAAVSNVNLYATTWTGLINSSTTAPGTPVLQIATTNSGTATNTVSCQIPLPSRTNPARGAYVADATWIYGLQQTGANATQVAVEASGTLNGIAAFGKIVLPAAGASETPSTVAQARADAGTIVLTPAKASFNASTTTTGAFVTQKIAPGAPFGLTTDLTIYYANFTVLETATSASTLQVAGVMVHYYQVTGL